MNGYKVVVNGHGTHTSYAYSLPAQTEDGAWTPGAWMSTEGKLAHCFNGFHFCESLADVHRRWWQWGGAIYEIETGEEVLPPDDAKRVAREMRLLRPLPPPAWQVRAEAFVKQVRGMAFFQASAPLALDYPHRLFESRAAAEAAAEAAAYNAAYDAAEAAAYTAAHNAAWDAAWDGAYAAAYDGAYAAAHNAAWDAAIDAAHDAAIDAAHNAAFNAARNAALFCSVVAFGADLPIAEQHREYARAVWSAYQQGYAMYGDVSGVLYVYEAC